MSLGQSGVLSTRWIPGGDMWAAAWLQGAAALLIAIGSGTPEPNVATGIAALACLLAGLAVLHPKGLARYLHRRSVVLVLGSGLVVELLANVVMAPVAEAVYVLLLLAAGVTGVLALVLRGRASAVLFVGAVLAQFALACWMIAALGAPEGDVHMFQQQGLAALLSGENPYSLRYPNMAGPGSEFYAPELQIGDRLAFGFPYPPLSLLMAIPGYLIGGDVRYATAASITIGALLIGGLRPGTIAFGAGLIFAFSPLTFRILYYGWTEPFVALFLVATVFLASRLATSTIPVALGLLAAVKQYTLPVLIIAPLLLTDVRRRLGWRRIVIVALVTLAATAVPFVLWHPEDFTFSVVAVQAIQPLRVDSSSIPGLLARMNLYVPPAWFAFAVAGVALLLVAWRAPRTTAGYAGAVALVYLVFFLFSKQAFGNYFLFPLGALASAIAVTDVAADD